MSREHEGDGANAAPAPVLHARGDGVGATTCCLLGVTPHIYTSIRLAARLSI